jgi:outer membrane protein assembly factor BamB
MRKRTLITILLAALLLIVSCNTDNDGIFMQVSKSEEKTDVGSIVLLQFENNLFTARTRQHQLQTYNTTTRKWTLTKDAKATHATTSGHDVYWAASVKEAQGKHKIYKGVTSPTLHSDQEFKVIAMDPLYDLMVVENDFGKYDVHMVSNTGVKLVENLEFYQDYAPQLITQDSEIFVISGKSDKDAYKHHFTIDGGANTVAIDNINAPVVAMLKDGDGKVALLTSKGELYIAPTSGGVFTKVDGKVVPNFPTTRRPAGVPYPAFVYENKLYLQNRHNHLYTIDGDGVIEPFEDIDLSAVKGWSYLVETDKVYVGTSQNGIYEIDMIEETVTPL